MIRPSCSWTVAAAAALLSAMATPAVHAESHAESDKWRWTGKLYLWASGIKGTTITGGEIDVEFDDLVDNLDFALMGGVEASNGTRSFIGDLIYMDLEGEETSSLPGPGPGQRQAKGQLEGWVVNMLGAYRFGDTDRATADLIFGGRYLDIDVKIDVTNNLPPPFPGGNSFSGGDSVIDAVVGLRGGIKLSESFYVPYIVDVGKGESDLTWQAMVGIGWRPAWGEITLAYRQIEWEFDSGALQDIGFKGPGLMFKYNFN